MSFPSTGPVPAFRESRRVPPLLEHGPFATGFLFMLGVGCAGLVLSVFGVFLLAMLAAVGLSLGG